MSAHAVILDAHKARQETRKQKFSTEIALAGMVTWILAFGASRAIFGAGYVQTCPVSSTGPLGESADNSPEAIANNTFTRLDEDKNGRGLQVPWLSKPKSPIDPACNLESSNY